MSSSASSNRDSADEPAGPNRRQALEHRLQLARTDRDAYFELAAIYRSEGRPLHAAKILKQGHEIFPEDAEMLWEWEEARLARSLQQLTEVREMVAHTKSSLADQEVERIETDWATCRVAVCRARLERDESLQYLRLVLGEALYDLARYDEAIRELESLMANDAHSSAAAFWIGKCHLILGSDVKAMHFLRMASLRRSVTSAPRIRIAALKLLVDLADRHGLTATLQHYQSVLASVMEAAKNETAKEGNGHAKPAATPTPPVPSHTSDP